MKLKTIGLVGLLVSYASFSAAEVVSIETGNFNSIIILFKTDLSLKNSKVECNVLSIDGTIIGMGVSKRQEQVTRVMVGLPEDSINDIVDVICEEK